jgi:hypothetical protein
MALPHCNIESIHFPNPQILEFAMFVCALMQLEDAMLGSEFHAEAYSEAGRMGKIMQEAIERGPC